MNNKKFAYGRFSCREMIKQPEQVLILANFINPSQDEEKEKFI